VSNEAGVIVRDSPDEHRYEAWLDGELAGTAEYEPRDGWLIFTHTVVLPAFGGRGVGSRLVVGALDDVRARGLFATPQCPYFAAWIKAHPAYQDLVVGVRGPRRGRPPQTGEASDASERPGAGGGGA